MKTALILTTINVPTVLQLYRKLDPDVRFFVALEKDAPDAIKAFCDELDNCEWVIGGNRQYWQTSELTGWKTIARRNVALLEALKWGADIIVSVDDDNYPVGTDYFGAYVETIGTAFNGIKVRGGFKWFDPGSLQFPISGRRVVQRGFPQPALAVNDTMFEPVTDAKIGVAQGMILGNPDTSAVDRISQHPEVHQVSELLRAGIVSDPRECYAPLNSQNVAFVRELAPCFLMVPQYQRFDDIFGSFVAQRVMRERGYYVYFGQPFCFQQRNSHNLLRDLAQEQWGAEHILEFAAWLDAFLGVRDVVGFLKVMATNLPKFIPSGTQELWLAWLQDIESVLK